jgi:hypothetical protein
MTSPAATALLDQAEAAAAEGARVFQAASDMLGVPVQYVVPTGARLFVVEKLRRQGLTGRLTGCAHIHPSRPLPQFWAAWRPGRVRCSDCIAALMREMDGTPEQFRCDVCRQVDDEILSCQILMPAYAVPELLIAIGPTILAFGMCRQCAATCEDPPSATHSQDPGRPRGTRSTKPRGRRGAGRGRRR